MKSRNTSASGRPLDRLGNYSLVKRIAAGGMAEIYLAVRESRSGLRKFYVVKVLHHVNENAPELMKMLADEANIVSQLDHPNIVSVHDFEQTAERSFIVMDYVHGRDLRRILDLAESTQVRLPDVIAAYIIAEVCEALAYVHSRTKPDGTSLSLVHRDISPPNIIVGFDGEVKVTDFGVARSSMAGRHETRTGVIKGKLQYLPPEYAAGNMQDARGDIFATGLTLFELLTNSPAYSDRNGFGAMVEAIKSGAVPDLRRIRPDVPDELYNVVARALQPRPGQRYQVAEEMAAELRTFVSRKVPGFTRTRLRDVVRQLFQMAGADFPEMNSLLGPTIEATGLQHLAEIKGSSSGEEFVEFHPQHGLEEPEDDPFRKGQFINDGSGTYQDDLEDWAVAPTSTTLRRDGGGPPADDPNVPPPRILSPSGYMRDVNKDGDPSENATAEIEWDRPVEIPAGDIEPLDDDSPTGRVSGRSLRDLADPNKK